MLLIEKKYIRYEIEHRKYSSNVIAGVYEHIDEKGKKHEKRELLFACFLPKQLGDVFIQQIFDKQFTNS